jgi:hypothetical protein
MRVELNGEAQELAAGDDGYVAIAREWRDSDRVAVSLPMALRCEPLGDDRTRVAVCCGPVVLAADLGAEGMAPDVRRGMGGEAYRMHMEGPAMDTPWVVLDRDKPDLARGAEPLNFGVARCGVGEPGLWLRPFYRLQGTRYAIYLAPTLSVVKIDRFDDGIDSVDAVETTHNFQAWRFQRGESHGRTWVLSPQWFRYDLDVDPRDANTLRLTFARDEDATSFELCVDGAVVATPKLAPPAGTTPLFEQDFALPRQSTAGRSRVAIMIRVPPEPKAVERGATTVPPPPARRRTPRVFALATNPPPALHDAPRGK